MPLTPAHPLARAGAVALAAPALIVSAAFAGSLTPPPGPVAPSMKTLDQVEPRIPLNWTTALGDSTAFFRITQPGSYYFTQSVTGVSGKAGIVVACSNVTIDMRGYTFAGVPGSLECITIPGSGFYNNVTITNGNIVDWGGAGVNLSNGSGRNHRVSNLTVTNCGGAGINVGDSAVVTDCVSSWNNGPGFGGTSAVTFAHCTAESNKAHGFYMDGQCTVTDCTADGNLFNGVSAGSNSLVSNCSLTRNHWHGVEVASRCRVFGNNAAENGYVSGSGAGVHASGTANRIEGNNCTGADTGIWVNGTGNLIHRNTCADNTSNYSVSSGNACYVVNAALCPSLISGNSGGVSFGSSDPNANFAY